MARFLAAALLVVVGSLAGYRLESDRQARGKEAYVVSQAKRFDRTYAKADPVLFLFGGAASVVGFIGVYELIALGIYAAIRPRTERAA